MSESSRRLLTIGHSTHPIDVFLGLLRDHGVETLVDVRAFPASRRHPQFNAEALSAALKQAGITYQHMVTLGGRRKRQEAPSAENPWRNPSFANYADYTRTEAFQTALAELEARALAGPTAIMCAEALWWRCHRRIIADEAAKDGFAIVHILGPRQADEAERSPELPGI